MMCYLTVLKKARTPLGHRRSGSCVVQRTLVLTARVHLVPGHRPVNRKHQSRIDLNMYGGQCMFARVFTGTVGPMCSAHKGKFSEYGLAYT